MYIALPPATNATRCPSGDKTAAPGLSGGVVSRISWSRSRSCTHSELKLCASVRLNTTRLPSGATETPLA